MTDDRTAAPASAATPVSPALLSSFGERQFRWLFASNTAFFMAMSGQQVLRAWLAFTLTKDELALGIISVTVALPMLFISPAGGVIADRMDRRKLVAFAQAIVVIAEVLVFSLLMMGRLRFPHLLISAGVLGTAFPFMMPARQAIIANAVGRARMTNAMALNMAAVNTTRIIGPAAAGIMIARGGPELAYGINVAFFALALACILRVESALPDRSGPQASILNNLLEGMRFVGSDRLILTLLFFGLLPMFLIMPFQNLLVVFAEEVWSVGAQGLGMLSAAAGLGGLVGAAIVAWKSGAGSRLRMMFGASIAFGIFLALFALSPWYRLALPMVFLASAFANLFSTLNNTAIQVLIPDAVRGRVSSFLMMSFSLPLLGTLPVSALARAYGAPIAITAASGLAVLITGAFFWFAPALRTMDSRLREALKE